MNETEHTHEVTLTRLPGGYTIPNITPALTPKCSHSAVDPIGMRWLDCRKPATVEATWEGADGWGRSDYFCDQHCDIDPDDYEDDLETLR